MVSRLMGSTEGGRLDIGGKNNPFGERYPFMLHLMGFEEMIKDRRKVQNYD
jgi:hypothetical protein